MLPTAAVLGVGAIEVPVPPVLVKYHNKFVPVAVKATAVAPWQYVTGEVTVGAAVVAVTVTVIAALGLSQLLADWLT
jgi:hypothetical protein